MKVQSVLRVCKRGKRECVSVGDQATRAYSYEMETPQATGPVAPGLEDVVARLIARASGTVEPAGAPQK